MSDIQTDSKAYSRKNPNVGGEMIQGAYDQHPEMPHE